ncbi:restriction endonuclease subunit S [Streptomyces sp. NPDC059928]|uniref:restriction endonuclease subunit S n=1 Tax=unclassified Streptomyces TaxID=2593676 RepID=UPI003656E8CA
MDREPVDIQPEQEYRAFGMRSFGRGTIRYAPTIGSRLTKLPHFNFKSTALVLSNIKAWEGAVGVTDEEDAKCVASSRFLFYVPKGEEVDVRYMRYFFLTREGLAEIGKASRGSADRNRTLSIRAFEQIKISLPHPIEQRRIADKLDAAMGSITRVVQLKKESDSLVQQHADSLLRSVDQVATLGSALRVDQDFVDVSSDEKYAVTGIYSFGKGLIKRPVIQGSETAYPRFARLRKGQVVMSKLNAWEGALAVVDERFSGTYVSPEYPVFSLNTEAADPEYIGHLLAWPDLWSRLTPRGSMVRRKRTTPATLLTTEVPLPSLPEQRRIAERLTLARGVAEFGARQVADLETLRKGLLDAAFSGRL